MPLEATFRQLTVSLHKLHDALNDLHLTLEDKPLGDKSALADGLETTVLDMQGTIHGARRAAKDAHKAVGLPLDLDEARRSLTICQERFHRVDQQFTSDLMAGKTLKELAKLGEERRAWLHWATGVKQALERCQSPIELVSAALAACWQELAGST